jgi:hypothetical protein
MDENVPNAAAAAPDPPHDPAPNIHVTPKKHREAGVLEGEQLEGATPKPLISPAS